MPARSSCRRTHPLTSAAALVAASLLGGSVSAQPQQPSQPAPAADPAAPAPAEVFARHVEALGGAAKFKERTNSISEGTIASDDGKFFALITIWNVAPRSCSVLVEVPGTRTEQLFFNGEFGWATNPDGQAGIIMGQTLVDLAQSADMYAPVEMDRVYRNARTVGKVDFRGKSCWQVDAESMYRKQETLYFDVQTGLLHAVKTAMAGANGVKPAVIVLEEYKDVDGAKIPVKTRQEVEGASPATIKINSIRPNVEASELPDFKTPDWLLKTVENQKQQGQPSAPPGR